MPSPRPVILFVCSHNSSRSQMAEGWLRHLASDRFEAASAGVEPGTLNPFAVRAMAEVGVDISGHVAQDVSDYTNRDDIAHVVVVCDQASATCPRVWAGRPISATANDGGGMIEWFFDDPAAATGSDDEKLAAFRHVRDEIRDQLEQRLAQAPAASARA